MPIPQGGCGGPCTRAPWSRADTPKQHATSPLSLQPQDPTSPANTTGTSCNVSLRARPGWRSSLSGWLRGACQEEETCTSGLRRCRWGGGLSRHPPPQPPGAQPPPLVDAGEHGYSLALFIEQMNEYFGIWVKTQTHRLLITAIYVWEKQNCETNTAGAWGPAAPGSPKRHMGLDASPRALWLPGRRGPSQTVKSQAAASCFNLPPSRGPSTPVVPQETPSLGWHSSRPSLALPQVAQRWAPGG